MTSIDTTRDLRTPDRKGVGRTFRPEPFWVWALVLAALVARLWFLAWQYWPDRDLLRWAVVDAQVREVALIAGPVVAVVAAVVGQWNHTIALGPAGVRPRWSIVGRQVAVMGAAILAGVAIGITPLMYMAVSYSAYGGPSPGVYVGGMAGLMLFLAMGYTIGAVWNNRLAVLAAAVVAGLLLLGPIMANGATSAGPDSTGFSWLSIAPVWLGDVPPVSGFTTVEATMWSRAAVFIIAVGALIYLAIAGTRRMDDLDRSRFAGFLPLAIPLALAFVLLQRQPFLMEPITEIDCMPAVSGEICTTADSANALQSSTDGFDTVMKAFAPPSLTENDDIHKVVLPDTLEGAYAIGAMAAAEDLTGATACMEELAKRDYVVAQGDPFDDHWFVGQVVGWNILKRSGQQAYEPESMGDVQRILAEGLSQLSDEELRQLIDVNYAALRACELDPKNITGS